MNTTFIYKGTTITTPNLEKKLKRMKITKDDIQIIDEQIKNKKIIKELRHLEGCFEANYSGGFQCYYEKQEEIPEKIGERILVNILPYDRWVNEYLM